MLKFKCLALFTALAITLGGTAAIADESPADTLSENIEQIATASEEAPTTPDEAEKENGLYLYVSLDGTESGDGTKEKPFAKLEKARDYLRKIRDKDAYSEIKVYIRGGTYEIDNSFKLTSLDKGTEKNPIIYTAYPGEKVIFSGGKRVNLSQAKLVSDRTILNKIPEEARGSIYEVDLKPQGLTGMEITNQTLYGVGTNTIPDLMMDGVNGNVARWPDAEDGYARTGAVLYALPGWYTDAGTRRPPEDDPGVIFKMEAPHLDKWDDAPNAWMAGYFMNDWAYESVAVKRIVKNMVFTKTSPGFSVAKGRPFFIYNLIEELDAPGEWFIDRYTDILYFYPREEISEATEYVFTKLDEPMVFMEYSQYINFENIIFEKSRNNAVRMSNSEYCMVKGSVIRQLSGGAINIDGGHYNGVLSCDIYDIGATAIRMHGGDINTCEDGGNFVINCKIHNYARIQRTYQAAVNTSGCGNYISNCEFYNAPHLAVQATGMHHVVEYNHIYDVVKETADSGAVYTGKSFLGSGMTFRYNYLHDIGNNIGSSMTSVGIYLDDMFCGGTVYGNIMDRVNEGILIGGGARNVVMNNIIMNGPENSKTAFSYDSRGSEDRWQGTLTNTMMPKAQAVPYKSKIWKTLHPEVENFEKEDYRMPINSVVANNVIVNHAPVEWHENLYKYGYVGDNLIEDNIDLGFENYEAGDLRLRENSVIYKQLPDFKYIPFERIGLYLDEYRTSQYEEVIE